MIAGPRLRAGRANSAKGAARMVAQAISTARAISADTTILVRGDSAFGSRAVVGTCIRHGAQFSVAMARNSTIDKTIGDRLDPGPEQRPEDVGLLCQRLHQLSEKSPPRDEPLGPLAAAGSEPLARSRSHQH